MLQSDALQVAAFHADIEASPWSESQWNDAYQNAADAWVIVDESKVSALDGESSNLVVGYAIFQTVFEQSEILNFGIRKEYQGKGLGQELLESVISLLPDAVTEIFLDVRRSNIPARNLYAKVGFEEINERRDYYPVAGGTREDAIIMKKRLILAN